MSYVNLSGSMAQCWTSKDTHFQSDLFCEYTHSVLAWLDSPSAFHPCASSRRDISLQPIVLSIKGTCEDCLALEWSKQGEPVCDSEAGRVRWVHCLGYDEGTEMEETIRVVDKSYHIFRRCPHIPCERSIVREEEWPDHFRAEILLPTTTPFK